MREDEEGDELTTPTALTTVPVKTSWLSGFLSHTGQADHHHEHAIEVVLPGKKK